jgi:HEPN domain-containing protein
MSLSAQGYKAAAEEHVLAARELYELRRYALAFYVSGLAVECMLRAYRVRIDPVFDARHDLQRLFEDAHFGHGLDEQRLMAAWSGLATVVARWSNDHRYRGEEALRRYLKRAALDRGIKGDFLKENARRIISAATELVSIGVQRWNHSLNS